MAQSKKKWVVFKSNTRVPADVIGAETDQKMQVGEPVQLPQAYAEHVVHDGFAAFCDAPQKAAPKKPGGPSADEKAAATLAAAQARVDGLNARMAEMTEGHPEWEGLTQEIDEAVSALAALQPAS